MIDLSEEYKHLLSEISKSVKNHQLPAIKEKLKSDCIVSSSICMDNIEEIAKLFQLLESEDILSVKCIQALNTITNVLQDVYITCLYERYELYLYRSHPEFIGKNQLFLKIFLIFKLKD